MANEKSQRILLVVLLVVAVAATSVAVTLWMTRSSGTPSQTAGAPAPTTPSSITSNAAPAADALGATTQTEVVINERPVTPEQINMLRSQYGATPPAGRYWYDSRSGLYGMWGREAGGYIRPGHDFGPLPANASNGNTGVFINGRQLNMTEAMYLQLIFGVVYQGRWWLDGTSGNVGIEGNPSPLGNIFAAVRAAQQRGGGDNTYRWRDGSGAALASSGNCTMFSAPGSPTYATSGCD